MQIVKIIAVIFIILLLATLAFFVYVDSLIPRSEPIEYAIEFIKEDKQLLHQIGEVESTEYRNDNLPDEKLDSVQVTFVLNGNKDTATVHATVVRIRGVWNVKSYRYE